MTEQIISRTEYEDEQAIVRTATLIRQIAYRKMRAIQTDLVEDILQIVLARLWHWSERKAGAGLTDEEWSRLANKVTHNEIRRLLRRQFTENRKLSEMVVSRDPLIRSEHTFSASTEGNTDAEIRSILLLVWKNLSHYTCLEKCSYLLKSADLSRLLISHRCCGIGELAEALGLTSVEFLELIGSLPLSDKDIVSFIEQKLALELTPKKILDARYRVRLRLYRALNETGREPGNNGNTPITGNTAASVKGPFDR
jgi:hypothetical protein